MKTNPKEDVPFQRQKRESIENFLCMRIQTYFDEAPFGPSVAVDYTLKYQNE